MISKEDEEFVRISLLLLKGGGLITKETLKKKINNSGQPIDVLLNSFQDELKHNFNRKQYYKLIPSGGHTNIEEWDIQMITTVLLTVFKNSLTPDEERAIMKIKYIRNDIYAHKSVSSSLSLSDYEDIRKELVGAIKTFSSNMDETEENNFACLIEECIEWPTKCNIETLIQGFFQSEELLDDVIEKLRCYNDEFRIKIDALIEPLRKEIIEGLSEVLRDEDKSINKIIVVLGLELTLKGDKNMSELVDKAEIQLLKDFNVAIAKSGNSDQSNVYEAVEKLVRVIQKINDVEIRPAKNKCIFMQFVCRSYTGLHSFMLYLESEDFKQHLQNIAMEIEKVDEFKTSSYSFSSRLVPKSLKEVFRAIRDDVHDTDENTGHSFGTNAISDTSIDKGDHDEIKNMNSNTASADVGTHITIQPLMTEKVTPEPITISDIPSKLRAENESTYSRTIEIPVEVRSRDGMDKVKHLFERRDTREIINMISNTVSSDVGTNITIQPSMTMKVPAKPTTISNIPSKLHGDDVHDTDENTGHSFGTNVISDTSKDEGDHDGTDDLLRCILLYKSSQCHRGSDSGVGDDSVSQMSSFSLADTDDEPIDKIKLGQAVNLYGRNNNVQTTVGPFISVDGTNTKYFLTVGCFPADLGDTAFLPACKRYARVKAWNPKDFTTLFEVVDDTDSTLQDKESDANIKPDKPSLSAGTLVYKIGVSGLTKGVIYGRKTFTFCHTQPIDGHHGQLIIHDLLGVISTWEEKFADIGDSGAAVFCKTGDRWVCIGILIGGLESQNLYYIKNIDDVIEELQNILGKNLGLDHHTMSLQMSKAFEFKCI